MSVSIEVPDYNSLKRRRYRVGGCLNHCSLILELGDSPYRVAMGRLGGLHGIRHCWLEAEEVVVDLTQQERFYSFGDYYAEFEPTGVHYFTKKDIAIKCLEGSPITFWEMPDPYEEWLGAQREASR